MNNIFIMIIQRSSGKKGQGPVMATVSKQEGNKTELRVHRSLVQGFFKCMLKAITTNIFIISITEKVGQRMHMKGNVLILEPALNGGVSLSLIFTTRIAFAMTITLPYIAICYITLHYIQLR